MAAGRIMARSAVRQGVIADQMAGDVAAALGLRRVAALAGSLGRPQDALTIVHIAGTKGKGSTVAFLSAMLVAAGHRTGRYTSPHLAKLTERITVDEVDLDVDTFAEVADLVLAAAVGLERDRPELGPVNALEILLVMALVAFREAGCPVAVIEVGIGGRLDTTNIVEPAVSVITTLDLEHTAILGDTLAAIAAEKAGIVKAGRPVVVAPQPEEAMAVIRARALKLGSELVEVAATPSTPAASANGLLGEHQLLNAALALAVLDALAEIDPSLAVDPAQRQVGLVNAWLPGRFEVIPAEAIRRAVGGDPVRPAPRVILDGAHTPRAAAALRVSLDRQAGPEPVANEVTVCGFASDKDVRAFLAALRPTTILPVVAISPRAVPAGEIASIAQGLGIAVRDGPSSVGAALHRLVEHDPRPDRIVVTGSFLVVAEARTALGLAGRLTASSTGSERSGARPRNGRDETKRSDAS